MQQESHHSSPNQILDCLLNLFHIYSSRQIEILIKKVTVPVLFSGPCPCPSCPGAGACPCFIPNSISDIDLCLVSWKGFFSDHISNQNDKVAIQDPLCPLLYLLDSLMKSIRSRIGQKILRLPTFLNWLQVN